MKYIKPIKKIIFYYFLNGEARGYKEYLTKNYDFNQNQIVHVDSYQQFKN